MNAELDLDHLEPKFSSNFSQMAELDLLCSTPFVCLVADLLANQAMTDHQKGISGMPAANAAQAPLFSGRMKDILDFFEDIKQQATSCRLTRPEKCSVITCYLSDKKTQNLWKNDNGWKDSKWDEFKTSILEEYLDANKAD